MTAIDDAIRLHYVGQWAKAAEALPPAIEAATASGEHAKAIEGSIVLGCARYQLNQLDSATSTFTEAIDRSGDWPALHARACWEKGVMYRDAALVDRAIAAWTGAGDEEALAWAAFGRAYATGLRGELATARELYAASLPELERVVGSTNERLVDVLGAVATFHDSCEEADAAHAARVRAFEVAKAFAGPGAQVTVNTAYYVATRRIVEGLACFDACVTATDDALALATLWYARSAALVPHDPGDALRGKETALIFRERALGILDHSLIPNRTEIKDGWNARNEPEEAEAFLVRCRKRTTPETWLYRNLTYEIGYMLQGQQRRDEYAALWKDFLAGREAACAPNSAEVIEALEIVSGNLTHYVPPEESLALSERLLALKPTRAGLRALAQAHRKADRRDEARAAWRRAIDQWIEELRAGTIEDEPAISAWSADYEAYGSFPPSGPPTEAQLAAVAVYDDAIERAIAVVGADQAKLAKVFLGRGQLLSIYSMRLDEAVADLTRARTLLESVEGPHGSNVCYALYLLSDHHDKHSPREVAIAALRDTIVARKAAGDFEHHYDRARLSQWLEQRNDDGDLAEAIAIREELVTDWLASTVPSQVMQELDQLVRMHVQHDDLAAAVATCERFATVLHHASQYDRHYAIDGWWRVVRAKCDADDLDGAKAAIDAMVELWDLPEVTAAIEERLADAESRDLPVAAHFRERVEARAYAGIDVSRTLEASLAPVLTPDTALVLADVLTSVGDPRGELIVVQHRLASAPDDSTLVERQRQLLASHRTRFLGLLEASHVTWHLGYWKTVELRAYPRRLYTELRAILEHPSARHLDTLVFQDDRDDLEQITSELAEQLARIPNVRTP